MRIIPVARGKAAAFIDDADFDRLSRHSWALGGGGKRYAYANIDGRVVAMHRLLAGAQPGQQVDHIDGNPLNNQRANLRCCTAKENRRNTRKRSPASSRFKGVTWSKEKRRWVAYIAPGGRFRYLGTFDSETDAARAYDAAAVALYGAFAHLNLPEAAA